MRGRVDGAVEGLAGFDEEGAPLGEGGRGGHGVVVASEGEANVVHFDVAARFEVAVGVGGRLGWSTGRKGKGEKSHARICLLVEARPVFH